MINQQINHNRVLWTLSFAQFLVMQIWFNFSAVLVSLKDSWELTHFQAGMIVSMFQLGYVFAVFFFSFLSDSRSPQIIFITGALITGVSSILFAFLAKGFYSALLLRTLAGIGMGGVYVPGMRLLSAVFPSEMRGKAIGIYVGSLVLGSGASLLLSGILVKWLDWQMLIFLTSVGAIFGAVLVYSLGQVPVQMARNHLDGKLLKSVWTKPNLLMNGGYLGHMWELYAMWPWIGPFLVAMYIQHGYSSEDAAMLGNVVGGLAIMIGCLATALGGSLSDRKGRIRTILFFLVGSIVCSFSIGWAGEWSIYAAVLLSLVYGFLIIGDSPIFSTAITELADIRVVGLALGIQSVLGFGVTIVSPSVFGWLLDSTQSWGIAFASLGLGACIGPIALWKLKKLPESYRMAGGKQ